MVRTVASSLRFPHHISESLLSQAAEFHIDVIQVPSQGSSGPLHNHCVPLQNDVNIFWNVDILVAENGLHSCSRCGKEPFLVFKHKYAHAHTQLRTRWSHRGFLCDWTRHPPVNLLHAQSELDITTMWGIEGIFHIS